MRPKTPMQIRWLRVKRHLRTLDTNPRALRDAARAVSGETPRRRLCAERRGLCLAPARLAA